MKEFKTFFITLLILVFTNSDQVEAIHRIAIEGMPGAGKSTSMLELISEFQDRCILLSETNPEPNAEWQDYSVTDQGDIFHQLWTTRMSLSEALEPLTTCILFDRSYYSNLAYKFASDNYCKTNFYASYIDIFNRDLRNKQYSLIIILDVSPEIGLMRRHSLKDSISYPWTEVEFLDEFRNFYQNELVKFTDCPILIICTDHLSPHEVKAKIKLEIEKIIGPCVEDSFKKTFSNEDADQILSFGQEKNLGNHHSQVINVLGLPTIYFRQHSVQIYKGEPVFFNNKQLKDIINEHTNK